MIDTREEVGRKKHAEYSMPPGSNSAAPANRWNAVIGDVLRNPDVSRMRKHVHEVAAGL